MEVDSIQKYYCINGFQGPLLPFFCDGKDLGMAPLILAERRVLNYVPPLLRGKVPSHQICRFLSTSRYSGSVLAAGFRRRAGMK